MLPPGRRSQPYRRVWLPIYCETSKGNGAIKGSFTCFGHPKLTQARADITQFLNLIIVKVDGSKQEAKVEITEAHAIF